MPTPSEPRIRGEWTASTDTPRRSIFGNYRPDDPRSPDATAAGGNRQPAPPSDSTAGTGVLSALELAIARSFLARFLAKAYEDPTPDGWDWLCAPDTRRSVAAAALACGIAPLSGSAFVPGEYSSYLDAYVATFGHAARGGCPMNEIEYGDIKADPLFQPHRLADLAGFYRAFGLEVTGEAGERQDHISIELEFLCVLGAKEAFALQQGLGDTPLAQCQEAQAGFLREHLGRWVPAFARRLAAGSADPTLPSLANFTRAYIESECSRLGVKPGSEELALRPVDEAADRMCESCGIHNLPPGALAAT